MRNVDAQFQPEHRHVAATAVLVISADRPFTVGLVPHFRGTEQPHSSFGDARR